MRPEDRRNLLPPDPADWQDGTIIRTEKATDGTWRAILRMGSVDY